MQRPPFISSTRKDLAPHRQAVARILGEYGQLPIAMETFGAWPADARMLVDERGYRLLRAWLGGAALRTRAP